jgi:hypothetical protein
MNDEKLKNGLSPEALAQEEKRRVESGDCKNLECHNAGRSRVLMPSDRLGPEFQVLLSIAPSEPHPSPTGASP